MKVEIIFHNRTTRITSATVTIDGKKFIFKGEQAKELAKMANNDMGTIKKYIESLVCVS